MPIEYHLAVGEYHLPVGRATHVGVPAGAAHVMTTDSQTYGRAYYATYCGGVYERNEHWTAFFGGIADRIVADPCPRTMLDAGCAMGFLVESLRDRGVEAEGIDVSDHAISEAREDVRPHLQVASLLDPLRSRWDVITCIEVLEHLPAEDVGTAITHLCAATDDILLSTTPREYREATHLNVRPPEYWAEMFLRENFVHDIEYDASYISPWAMRFRRSRDPLARQVVVMERELWRLREEKLARDDLILEQAREVARRDAENEWLRTVTNERDALAAEAGRLGLDLRDCDAQLRNALSRIGDLEDEQRAARHDAEAAGRHLDAVLQSASYRIARRLRRVVRTVAPEDTAHGRAVTATVRSARALRTHGTRQVATRLAARVQTQFLPQQTARPAAGSPQQAPPALGEVDQRWNAFLATHEPTDDDLHRMREVSRGWERRPLISILLPTYNPERWFLKAALDSVMAQAYENWELCVVDDCSSNSEAVRTLAEYEHEPRIRFETRPVNGGIAAASQSAAAMATGEYIAFLDHDDVLRPHALFDVAEHLRRHPDDDLVYSDEDKVDPFGRRVGAHLKPDWSPELLESCNYICHFTTIRRTLFDDAGGFRPGFDGSQDYDLFLRCTEKAHSVGHIPKVLYDWRMLPRSAAANRDAKPEAYVAARRALESAFERRGEKASVYESSYTGIYYVRRQVIGSPSVAVVIPTRDRVELLREAVASVEKESGSMSIRIVIVDNNSESAQTHRYLETCGHQVAAVPGAFNFSRVVNRGVAAAGDADHVLLLNNDIARGSVGWVQALVEQSQRPGVGAVGCRLVRPDGSVQHEGVRVGGQGVPADHLDLRDYFGMGKCIRTVSAVTGACLMVKRSLWDEVGGFDERLRVVYNDVDFCLRLMEAGYRNVYTPVAELVHQESASRGGHHPAEDERIFVDRWNPIRQGFDRYLGLNVWAFRPIVDYR